MPSQHYVPTFAQSLQASPRVQANALRALALVSHEPTESEWAPLAAAALYLGATIEGQPWTEAMVARTTGVPEAALIRHLAALSDAVQRKGGL